jgi:hypothetical protein
MRLIPVAAAGSLGMEHVANADWLTHASCHADPHSFAYKLGLCRADRTESLIDAHTKLATRAPASDRG